MYILFLHPNFPAQFGQIASALARRPDIECGFLTEKPSGIHNGIELIQYVNKGGATASTHFCSRTFENWTWHTHAAYEAMLARPDIRPDLIVSHSGFCSPIMLRHLYDDCPIINYFEIYYRTKNCDLDFRPDRVPNELTQLRARIRNGHLLLDLDNCDAGYSPTHYQKQSFPKEFQNKLRALFDGIDTEFWRRLKNPPLEIEGHRLPKGCKIVTYVSRGLESMRGFDVFMHTAYELCRQRSDVFFIVIGQPKSCYGNDESYTNGISFKEHVLRQRPFEMSRFLFLDRVSPTTLVQVFSVSDLHIYLTVPFVLSWSLFNALSCEATVLVSDTEPVRELVTESVTGFLKDFFDVEGLVAKSNQILNDPVAHRHTGRQGRELIQEKYSLTTCLPRHLAL